MKYIFPTFIGFYFTCLMIYSYDSSIKFWISVFGIYINFGAVAKILNFNENMSNDSEYNDLLMISIGTLIFLTVPIILI